MTTGEALKAARAARGMSLRDAEKALAKRGIDLSPQQIGNYETGKSRLRVDLVPHFAAIYEQDAAFCLPFLTTEG